MILGVVKGEVYSTINHPFYDRRRILLVDRIHPDGTEQDGYLIALDAVDAGVGDTVLMIDEGNSARQVTDDPMGPVRSVIVGVIDEIQVTAASDHPSSR